MSGILFIHFINESTSGNLRPYSNPFTNLYTSVGPNSTEEELNNS